MTFWYFLQKFSVFYLNLRFFFIQKGVFRKYERNTVPDRRLEK